LPRNLSYIYNGDKQFHWTLIKEPILFLLFIGQLKKPYARSNNLNVGAKSFNS